ncbi:hypothetical protein [Streptomyces sp. SID12501]|uniref:Uncharacterized protein n=1 Tax=Streptomyces sp. SID12501 TaxID=2706042 RepID=A0A6B3BUF6_9ACTN|nr:hypothetical protein [Streptomyces sp. SID12501]NEC87995.1 hypothetical protein [Streptomyces sp. SID12501]
MAQQRFMRRGITKILWLKNIAAATRIPTRAEISAPNSTDLTEAMRRRSLPERVLQICDDTARRTEYDEAKRSAARAELLAGSDPDNAPLAARATAAAERYEAARKAFDTASISLRFRAPPRPVLEELIHAHPPTDQQAADGAAFNAETLLSFRSEGDAASST